MTPSLPLPHSLFEAFARRGILTAKHPAWVRELRQNSWSDAVRMGLPSTRHEEWKYTSLRGLQDLGTKSIDKRAATPSLARSPDENLAVSQALQLGDNPLEVIIQDGRCIVDDKKIPSGVRLIDLSQAVDSTSEVGDVESFIRECQTLAASIPQTGPLGVAEHTWLHNDVFSALGQAFLSGGVLISVAKDVSTPFIRLRHCSSARPEDGLATVRVMIRVQSGAVLRLVETFESGFEDVASSLHLAETDILASASSKVLHGRVIQGAYKESTVHRSRYFVKKDAVVSSFVLSNGGPLSRHQLGGALLEPGAHINLNGLSLVGDGELVDHHTSVEHVAPNTTSQQNYRSVVGGKGRSVFNGKVFIRRSAPGSSALQSNKNILLSKDGEVDTKPQLEIDIDDVKCSHGATIGQVNPDELFYLRSRGITEADGKRLLALGFANESLGEDWSPVFGAALGKALHTLIAKGDAT